MFNKSITETNHTNPFSEKSGRKSIWSDFEDKADIDRVEIIDIIESINPDESYDLWLDVGCAICSTGFDIEVWIDWSKNSKTKTLEDYQYQWEHFETCYHERTLGWLIERVTGKGYQLPCHLDKLWKAHKFKSALKSGFPLFHSSELSFMPQREYLIKGFIDRGGMSVLYGASNSGKTFVAIDIACHIALGWSWCDKKTKQGAVVYIAAEGGLGISERLTAFRISYQLDGYPDLYVLPCAVNLGKDGADLEKLLERLDQIVNIELIIVDTLARTMGAGEENNSLDMGAYIKNCDIIRQRTGAHIMVVHHTGKDEGRGARGHSSLRAAIDTEIEVSQKNQIVAVTLTKQREGRVGDSLCFQFKEFEVKRDEDNYPIYSCALERVDIKKQKQTLTGHAFSAYQLLLNLFLDNSIDLVPKKGMNPQKCVRVDDFKEHFMKSGIVETDKADSENRAFLRVKNGLKNKGYIAEWDNHIWLLDKADTA